MSELGNLNEVETPEQKSNGDIPKAPEATEGDKEKLEKPSNSEVNKPSKDNLKEPEDKLDSDERKQVSPELEDKGKEAQDEDPAKKIGKSDEINVPKEEGDSKEKNIEKQNNAIDDVESGKHPLETNKEKGNYGEMKTDQDMREKGYDRISNDMVTDLDDAGHQGIDGVYEKSDGHPPYVIADAKYGSSKLSDTDDGKQMSSEWIDNRLDDSVGKEKADEIRMAKLANPDDVGSYVSHVDENGGVKYDKLDDDANVTEKDVKF